MKIGVISDTHGDTKAWEKAQENFDRADFILHSGDVLYHGVFNPILDSYNGKILAEMINKSPIPLVFARGNCDSDVDQMALEYPIESLVTETVIDGLNILIHHGDKYSNKDLADKYRPDIIISGHTHVFGIERYKDTIFLNPGSPSLPKNTEQLPTIAMIENKTIKIIDINSGNVLIEESI